MNGDVKRDGIGIQVHDMMRNIKTCLRSDRYGGSKFGHLAKLSDDECYSQRSVMIHACLATTNSKT